MSGRRSRKTLSGHCALADPPVHVVLRLSLEIRRVSQKLIELAVAKFRDAWRYCQLPAKHQLRIAAFIRVASGSVCKKYGY